MSSLHYVIEASIDFSTVVPAVLSVTFLFERIFDERGVGKGWPLGVNRAWLALSAAAGIALLYLMTAFPQFLFPFAWIAPFLVFEPVLYVSGLPSLLRRIERGDWTLTLAVMSATLFTGVFWEMWNYCSLPKWLYTIPYIDFWKVFEMPLLGYGGYPFFGIIVMSFTLLALSLAGRRDLVRTAGWDA